MPSRHISGLVLRLYKNVREIFTVSVITVYGMHTIVAGFCDENSLAYSNIRVTKGNAGEFLSQIPYKYGVVLLVTQRALCTVVPYQRDDTAAVHLYRKLKTGYYWSVRKLDSIFCSYCYVKIPPITYCVSHGTCKSIHILTAA